MGSVFRFDTLDSTNTKAISLAREGVSEAAVVAKTQTGGRGRLGKSFDSPEGGLYLSVLTDRLTPGADVLALTPAAALAARRSILRTYGLACQIKYPNDLLLDGKKICGILCESLSEGEKFSAVIGAGINVCTDVPQPDDAPEYPPGSLKDFCEKAGDPASLQELESILIEELTSLIDAFAAGCRLDEAEYRRHCINCPETIVPFS
ncbi:MAG: biotin--[Firmicutes bacterium]|nr:biotin--[acetyl-CoA-carboxylase] ligase [Bacillota bacterium]